MEPRIFVTPHIGGSTDVMLNGTVKYLGEVLAEYQNGLRLASIIKQSVQID
jgi:phosphoglycerate dehydrogenase-like enzyme